MTAEDHWVALQVVTVRRLLLDGTTRDYREARGSLHETREAAEDHAGLTGAVIRVRIAPEGAALVVLEAPDVPDFAARARELAADIVVKDVRITYSDE